LTDPRPDPRLYFKMRAVAAVTILAAADAQKVGKLNAEKNPVLSVSTCDESGCKSQQQSVTIDSNWRWTHLDGEATNCFTGNQWNKTACPDEETCWKNCVIEGASKEYEGTYGVHAKSDSLTLDFITQGPYSKNVGSRTYLLDASGDEYQLFKLKNREFAFDVDASKLPCGLNGALYFVEMDADGGKSRHPKNEAGAKYGTGYCDAQCPHDLKWINGVANIGNWTPQATDPNAGLGKYGTCCTELDMWEANSISTAYTMHACSVSQQTRCEGIECGDNSGAVTPEAHRFDGVCDKNGCDFQTNRLGDKTFYGPGSNFKLDSTKKMTVVTQFVTDSGEDDGKVNEVRRFYMQDGKKIETPSLTVQGKQYDSITADFCQDWVETTKDGTNFLTKGGFDAVDQSLEKGVVLVMSLWDDHFANMLWLDSIYPTDSTDPTAYRGSCATTSGVAKDVETKNAKSSVTYSNIRSGPIGSTTGGSSPTPAPTPTPSDCPGGSLAACLASCPASIYKACAATCAARCSSVLV